MSEAGGDDASALGDDELDGNDVQETTLQADVDRPRSPPLASISGRYAWAPDEPISAPLPEDIWESSSMHTGSGWVRADYTVATFVFNAALTAARYDKLPVPRLNCNWHRPDDHDVKPLGENNRGDIAPPQVHVALSRILARCGETNHIVQKLAHGVADKVWFLHSRSRRLEEAVRCAFDFLPEAAHAQLVQAMRMNALKDLRLVACTVDPREKVIYGQTLDSAAAPRQWREIFFAHRNHPDHDSDPGGVTGSSPEATGLMRGDGELRYDQLSPSDEDRQMRRWADRRTRRFARSAQQAAERAQQAQVALEETLDRQTRAETLRDILVRGVASQRGPLPLTDTQTARAWYDHRVQHAASADPALMPPTP